MKKNGILNGDISRVLSYMRHTDTLCVGDCGLPCPDNVELIDLALRFGEPSFMSALKAILADMKVEKITLASEIKEKNAALDSQLQKIFAGIEIEYVPHSQFKEKTRQCKAVVRTGETTPYANVILQSACIF